MDIFQLIADMLHLVACLILILKILATRNVMGKYLITKDYHTKLKKFIV